jgi:hypothetical protein
MNEIGGLNPWMSIWSHPRATIRAISMEKPAYGFWILSTLYALYLSFSTANFYSWGLDRSFSAVFFPLVIVSPLTGFVWLTFQAFLLRIAGRILGGKASYQFVRAAVAWSRIPYAFALGMWIVLMAVHTESAFIQHAAGPSSLFIMLISLILHVWAIVLLVQLIREVQSFSLGRAIANVVLSWVFSFVIVSIIAITIRYIYINYI